MSAFVPPGSNRRLLEFLIARIRRLGRQLYVRDASVLGFPSYFVYVEGLSPVSEIREDRFVFLWHKHEKVRRTILNIDACSRREVAQVADLLFRELTRANPLLEVGFEQKILDAPVLYWMGFRPVVASMLIESGEYAKALTVLNLSFATTPSALKGSTFLSQALSLRVRARIGWHFGASAGRADARRRDAGDVMTSSRSGNAADARPPPRPEGLRLPGLADYRSCLVMIQLGIGAAAKCQIILARALSIHDENPLSSGPWRDCPYWHEPRR